MAVTAGKLGRVQYGGVDVLRLNNWTIDFDSSMIDVTTWSTGSVQFRSHIAGLTTVTGTVSGFWDVSTGSTAQRDMQGNVLTPTTAQLILYADNDAGGNYRGSVYLNRMSAAASIDDANTISFDFTGTGAWSYSTAT